MRKKLIIFDLDGTILNTLEDLTNSTNHALFEAGLPERTEREVRSFVGNGIKKLICRAVPEGTDEQTTELVFQSFTSYYALHCADRTKPYDGIIPLFRKILASGGMVTVVSNKADFAVQELCKRYFDGLVLFAAGEKEGVKRKPAPDTVNAVLKAFDQTNADAVYIGDSEVDIQTARNAHMECISVDWGFRDRTKLLSSGATTIVSSPEELFKNLSAKE